MKHLITILAAMILGMSCAQAGDHGGKEHGGNEVSDEAKKTNMGKDNEKKCAKGEEGDECRAQRDEAKEKGEKKGHEKGHKMKKGKKGAAYHSNGMRKVSAQEIKATLTKYIADNSDKNGIYTHIDADRDNAVMRLKFVKIHDPVRIMEKKGQYFACTDFEVVGENGKLHDLDFWMKPTDTGLEIVRRKVHKDPFMTNNKWEKRARYTFQGEDIVSIK
jgi:hypothetical protein